MKELFVAIIFIIFGKIYCQRYSYKNVNLKKIIKLTTILIGGQTEY